MPATTKGFAAVRKSNFVIMAKSTPLKNIETGKKSNQCKCFKQKF